MVTRPHPVPAPRPSGGALALPDVPALVVGAGRAVLLHPDGELEELEPAQARRRLRDVPPPLVCHARATARRLEASPFLAHDVLELFAFVRPARFCLPTPRGMAAALSLPLPTSLEDQALALPSIVAALLEEVRVAAEPDAAAIARTMADAGWIWGPVVGLALAQVRPGGVGMAVWRTLNDCPEHAPPAPPGHLPVQPAEARERLRRLLGSLAEAREPQQLYTEAVAHAFTPRDSVDGPKLVLAEAGTGVGKTLGYLAPATLWAERNNGAVWVSTYTRNLQHQIDQELDRLYPDPATKELKVVVRKGRENYLCLLNVEEAVRGLPARPGEAVALGLVARWAARTRDGDFSGADFPGWLPEVLGRGRTLGLADRRGECIYSACPHYNVCFIERSIRRARRADIVIANHALVMLQAALRGDDDSTLPSRLVFDEGHHVFDAADSAFSAALSGVEGEELRRWLLGAEGSRSRARGLRRRIEDLIGEDATDRRLLDESMARARVLPGEGWQRRLADDRPEGPVEAFLATIRQQLEARTPDGAEQFGRETELHPPIPGLVEAGLAAADALERLRAPLAELRARLVAQLEDEDTETLETATRLRIEAVGRSLNRRAILPLAGWVAMLRDLANQTPDHFVDWLATQRLEGRGDVDYGLHRHWIDPTEPFARAVVSPSHGVAITSATLTDGAGDPTLDWQAAEERIGAVHLAVPARRLTLPSPFDYADRTRVFVVTDVRKDDLGQVAAAYRALFRAARGGALGLFTAISRLRGVHQRIAGDLEQSGLPLYAQHVDGLEVRSLIDIFRAEEDACLLGTDAVRDGVDVPGRSLRLIVFDRVPWPRPDILHRARRDRFGGRGYDDAIARLRLRQAFGRLIRRAGDAGVFVLLDPMMPTRLLGAFPPGTPVERLGLRQTVEATREFLDRHI
ncbi:MAG: ATP-dependent DNA helicase [Alphaproteobacteria bacterium]|nr:ATP-dependent DNA helicase [Alphaproteobacteria bacterium]TAD90321.1 MAG: ATP-dependent DNA helicase [Alphaproteobacteria bacterium]